MASVSQLEAPRAAETAAPRSAWIISPAWDLLYLVLTPVAIVPVVWLLLSGELLTPERLSLVVIAFASMGHHLPGFMRAYGDPALLARFRWRFLLVPPLFFALALLYSPPPSVAQAFQLPWSHLQGLEVLLVLWGTWHGLMQTYGFMRIYDAKRAGGTRWNARLDLWLCLALFTAGFVFSDARMYHFVGVLWQMGVPIVDRSWLEQTRWVVGGATALIGAAYLVHLISTRGACGVCCQKLLLAVSTGALYWYTGMLAVNILVGIAMFEIFHAVQYYAIVWVYNRRLAAKGGERAGWLAFLFQDRWAMLGLYLAAIFVFGAARYALGDAGTQDVSLASLDVRKTLFALFVTSTFLHFYFDGFIWKVREKETRSNLAIDSGEARESRVPGAVHALKLVLFFGIAAGLAGLELSRGVRSPKQQEAIHAMLETWLPELPEARKYRTASQVEALRRSPMLRAALANATQNPESASLQAELGRQWFQQAEYAAAAEAYEAAIKLEPTNWLRYWDLAQTRDKLLDFAGAETAYREAIRLSPNPASVLDSLRESRESHARARFGQGIDAYQLGNLADAVASFQQAIELSPEFVEAYVNLGSTLLQQGKLSPAETALERAIKLKPEHDVAHFNLALVYLQQGNAAKAREHLNRAEELGHKIPDEVRAAARQN